MNLLRAGIFTLAVLAAPACKTSPDTVAANTAPKCGEAGAGAADCPKAEPPIAREVLAETELVTLSAKFITRDHDAGTVTLAADTSVKQATYVTWIFDGPSFDAVVGDNLKEDGTLKVKVLVVLKETKVVLPENNMPTPLGGFNYVTNTGKVLALAP